MEWLSQSQLTCGRGWRGALPSGRCGGGRALDGEGGLHHQLDAHHAQPAVGVRGDGPVRHQLVAVSEVPDVVDGGGLFEVAAGVMELDVEDHILTTVEDVGRLVDRSLLGDVDCHWDLIWERGRAWREQLNNSSWSRWMKMDKRGLVPTCDVEDAVVGGEGAVLPALTLPVDHDLHHLSAHRDAAGVQGDAGGGAVTGLVVLTCNQPSPRTSGLFLVAVGL